MHNDELAARHFTTSAVHIVEQLWPRAADRSSSTEINEQTVLMLALWSVLRWERKVGLVALERTGVEIDSLARDVNESLDAACAEVRERMGPPKLQKLPWGQLGVFVDRKTPLVPLLAAAEHEALGLGHHWVGSEHLLLAIVRLADPRLGEVLERHQVNYERLRRSVLDILEQ